MEELAAVLTRSPLIAVLRGMPPEEAAATSDALVDAGIKILEVTLDSPRPFESLALLAARHGRSAEVVVAAGTVLRPEQPAAAQEAGARLIVSPNFSPAVVAASKAAGLVSCPGVMTPTEAYNALEAGADLLKLFPGDAIGPNGTKALRAVLPAGVKLAVTGGVTAATLPAFLASGADGVGIGSALYKPGKPVGEIAADAARFVAAAKDGAA